MYPFERFSEDGKRTLTLAQEEAELSHHSYIGTEHLLLGLLRLKSGPAPIALRELGIEIQKVRETIAAVIGREERLIFQQVIPTSRVKTVIEIAFEEARDMGSDEVNSGHLLMGLVIEGEGIAAHVLADLGGGEKEVIAAVMRAMGVLPRERPTRKRLRRFQPPFPPRSVVISATSKMIASAIEQPPAASDLEMLHRLLRSPQIVALLRKRGLTEVDSLLANLGNPPDAVMKLRMELQTLRSNLAVAINLQRFEEAGRLQKQQRDLVKKLDSAEQEWLRKLID